MATNETTKPALEAPPSVTAVENCEERKGDQLNASDQENAVGYHEYLEARDVEFSDAEVSFVLIYRGKRGKKKRRD